MTTQLAVPKPTEKFGKYREAGLILDNWLKETRTERGTFAERAGVTERAVRDWINGHTYPRSEAVRSNLMKMDPRPPMAEMNAVVVKVKGLTMGSSLTPRQKEVVEAFASDPALAKAIEDLIADWKASGKKARR